MLFESLCILESLKEKKQGVKESERGIILDERMEQGSETWI